jgi:hypothetical protein
MREDKEKEKVYNIDQGFYYHCLYYHFLKEKYYKDNITNLKEKVDNLEKEKFTLREENKDLKRFMFLVINFNKFI